MTALLVTGLALLAAAGTLDLVAGVRRAWLRPLPYLLGAAGCGCLLALGVRAVTGAPAVIDAGDLFGFGPTRLVADPLAGLFLTISCGVAVAVSLGFASWVRPVGRAHGRGLGAAYALLVGAVVVVVLAGDAFAFLFAWELVTLAFYLLAGYDRRRPGRAAASWLTLALGKAGGAFLLLGFLLLAADAGSFTLASWSAVPPGALRSAAYILIIVGCGAKVGLVPLQVWMPAGYAAAPGPARALMAAVAVNIGFYGLWRMLGVLGGPPLWLAIAVLLVGSVTALLGVAHAAVQANLQRVIAYSSVENAGLILTGFGVALAGASLHQPALLAVGLLAATLQTVAHALAKGALFLASGTIETAIGTDVLDDLRGVARRLPFSGTGFTVGALALAGLPPTVGFASEWFLLEALMQQFRLSGLVVKLAMALAGALVALTVGFATVAFVRVLGLSILGADRPRSRRLPRLPDTGVAGRVGLAALAGGCLAVAAITPLEIRYLADGLAPVVPAHVTLGALGSPWVLQPVYPEFSVLSPPWLWVTMPLLLLAVAGFVAAVARPAMTRVRLVPPWRSATGGVAGEDRYTAFGYANPTRRVLASVLLTRSELHEVEADTGAEEGPGLRYRSDVVELVGAYLYRPLRRPLQALVQAAKRLQSGRLDAYLAYMLIALIGALAVAAVVA